MQRRVNVLAERVRARAGNNGGSFAKASRCDSDVGGTAAEKFLEVPDRDDAPIGGGVEVHTDTADSEDVEARTYVHLVRFPSGHSAGIPPTSHLDVIC